MKTLINLFFALLLFASPLFSQQESIPSWLMEEWTHLTNGTGVWITDNSEYKSEDEPFDAYGLEWKWGLGHKSITGKLYGLQNGRNIGTFWEFRNFWHPGDRKAIMEQFGGNGVYGVGEMNHKEGATSRMLQTFYAPDGSSNLVGHESTTTATEHLTISFEVNSTGVWTENRSYLWKPEPVDFSEFKWLLGNWERQGMSGTKTAHEKWEQTPTQLTGIGISMLGSDTLFMETLRIIKKGDDYFYVAEVAENQGPVLFKITSMNGKGFTSENPEHDFPQKIVYKREGETLSAEISGGDKKVPFTFTKSRNK